MPKTYRNLQDLTGHESGAVQYENDGIWIGNWSGFDGIPRSFASSTIGLGEKMTAEKCRVPNDVKEAMQAHEAQELEQGADSVNVTGFSAWEVNDAVVVVQDDWH